MLHAIAAHEGVAERVDRSAEMRAKLADVRDHLQLHRLALIESVRELEATRAAAQEYTSRLTFRAPRFGYGR